MNFDDNCSEQTLFALNCPEKTRGPKFLLKKDYFRFQMNLMCEKQSCLSNIDKLRFHELPMYMYSDLNFMSHNRIVMFICVLKFSQDFGIVS